MHVRPASSPDPTGCDGDDAERSEGHHVGDGAAGAFPWLTDTTRPSGGGQADPAPLSLVLRNGFQSDPEGHVVAIVRPSVGRATMVFVCAKPVRRNLVALDDGVRMLDLETGEISLASEWQKLDGEERDELNAERCNARAERSMSDYMIHNRLVKMWVLTFAEALHGIEGRRIAMERTAAFVRRLKRSLYRGKPFPYVYSPELHPGGHGWHVNLFLRADFIEKRSMDRLWGHGNTWYTDFREDRSDWLGRKIGKAPRAGGGGGSTHARRGAARAAAYGAKYGSKDWASDAIGPGAHRYERSEGFNVPEVRQTFDTLGAAYLWAGGHPSVGSVTFQWRRDYGEEGWHGPNARGFTFDPPSAQTRRVKGARKKSAVPISSDP